VGPIKPKIFFPVGDGNEEEIKRKKEKKEEIRHKNPIKLFNKSKRIRGI